MIDEELLVLHAIVRVLFRQQWDDIPGERFRALIQAVSECTENRNDQENSEEEPVGGPHPLPQANSHTARQLADALRAFAEEEDRKIDHEIKKRTLSSDALRAEAEAKKAQAEAEKAQLEVRMARERSSSDTRLAKTTVLAAEVRLLTDLIRIGVAPLSIDGTTNILPLPPDLNLLGALAKLADGAKHSADLYVDPEKPLEDADSGDTPSKPA
jgi:hypothetical protein